MRFTVVVATHNRSGLLVQALSSVRAQTRRADEIVVVADGCTDDTAEVVAGRFPDVVLIEQPNTGLAIARNTAIARASGDWLCFLDDDDTWEPTKLEAVERLIAREQGVRAVYHPVWTLKDGVRSGPVHTEDFGGKGLSRLLLSVPSVPSALAVERHTAIRAGLFPPHVAYGEDWIFDVNVGRLTTWRLLPEPLATVRLDGQRMSAPGARTRPTLFLAAPVSLWTGRPDPDRLAELRLAHRAMYRPVLQQSIASRHWEETAELWRWLRILLPRRWDRMFLVVPEPVLRAARRLRRPRPRAGVPSARS